MRLWLSVAAVIGLFILAALMAMDSKPKQPVLAEGLRLALLQFSSLPRSVA